MRSSVDLPHPDGPTRTVNEPSAMSMSTPCRTAVSPKVLRTDWMVTLAMGFARGKARLGEYGEPPPGRHEGKPVEGERARRAATILGS